jgi:hypothetical protein
MSDTTTPMSEADERAKALGASWDKVTRLAEQLKKAREDLVADIRAAEDARLNAAKLADGPRGYVDSVLGAALKRVPQAIRTAAKKG